MPRAEAGSTKAIANAMKAKGLQRLRWYCQVCEKQCRDQNAFKQHCLSESHVRQMQVVGQNAGKFINEYSTQFLKDFVQLLRTSHGEKRVHINHFYQEYISNKTHVHMNSTKWNSLTEFAKYLGREGICRVDEEEPGESGRGGIFISWIDNSPEALRRQEAIRKKERQDKGDEEREQAMIRAQIARAHKDKGLDDDSEVEEEDERVRELQRAEGEKIKLSFAPKLSTTPKPPSPSSVEKESDQSSRSAHPETPTLPTEAASTESSLTASPLAPMPKATSSAPSISIKPKNVFASAKKSNPLAVKKSSAPIPQQKAMSEAERIMKEELERKRLREERMGGGGKRQKLY